MNKFFLFLLIPFLVSAVTYEVTVPANVQWFDSEIEIYDNESISIISSGEWQYDPRPNFKTGPDGIVKGSISKGSLLMKCNDEVILIGSKWEGVIKENCILEFGMYDDLSYSTNVGEMIVRIKMDRESAYDIEEENDEINDDLNQNENELESEEEVKDTSLENQICSVFALIILFLVGVLYVYEKR